MTSFFVASEAGLKRNLNREFIHMKTPMPEDLAPFFTLLKQTNSPTKFYYQRRKLEDTSPPPHAAAAVESEQAEADLDPIDANPDLVVLTPDFAELNLEEPERYRNEVKQVASDLKSALFAGEPSEGFLAQLQNLIIGDPRRDLLSPSTSDIDRLLKQINEKDFESPKAKKDLVHMSLANAIVDSNPKALEIARGFLICEYEKASSSSEEDKELSSEGEEIEAGEAHLGQVNVFGEEGGVVAQILNIKPVVALLEFSNPMYMTFSDETLRLLPIADHLDTPAIAFQMLTAFVLKMDTLDKISKRAEAFKEYFKKNGSQQMLMIWRLAIPENYEIFKDLYSKFPRFDESADRRVHLDAFWYMLENMGFPSGLHLTQKMIVGTGGKPLSAATMAVKVNALTEMLTWPLAGFHDSASGGVTFQSHFEALKYLVEHAHDSGVKGYWLAIEEEDKDKHFILEESKGAGSKRGISEAKKKKKEAEGEAEKEEEKTRRIVKVKEAHVVNALVPMYVMDSAGFPELNDKGTGPDVDEDYVRSWTNVSLGVK